MAECSISTLIQQACQSKFTCLDEKTAQGIILQLLCNLVNAPAGSVAWGDITGLLANQSDLAAALTARILAANNLSDLTNAATARTNLGLGTASVQNVGAFLQPANNLSDVSSAATARTNLGCVGYVMNLLTGGGGSPADATTYYFGGDLMSGFAGSIHTAFATDRIEVPKGGTIKRVFLKVRSAVAGTSETVSHYIRINDTTDVGQIDLTYDATTREGTNSSVSQAVTAGDYIALKVVCPTWVTNPTTVRWYCTVYIE